MIPPRSHGRIAARVSARPRPLIGPDKAPPGAFRVQVLTLFPELFPGPLGHSLIGRALADGLWALEVLDIRQHSPHKHRSVDDTPAGGGPGMVMRADVVAAAIDAAGQGAIPDRGAWPLVYLSPRGRPFTQGIAQAWAAGQGITLLCGRFEGVDQRVLDARAVQEISLGDFVLSGGEIAAYAVLDATLRLRPGVLGNAGSIVEESFSAGLLEHPQYTRPPEWEGRRVPEVLLSGNHARINAWRRAQAEAVTKDRRPDLWRAHGDPDLTAEHSDAPTGPQTGEKED